MDRLKIINPTEKGFATSKIQIKFILESLKMGKCRDLGNLMKLMEIFIEDSLSLIKRKEEGFLSGLEQSQRYMKENF